MEIKDTRRSNTENSNEEMEISYNGDQMPYGGSSIQEGSKFESLPPLPDTPTTGSVTSEEVNKK